MATVESRDDQSLGWRERAVSRSVDAARVRAEGRVQRLLDAALDLIVQKGTTDFALQEVILHSKLSLRSFYESFDSKDDLVLALFEETVSSARDDIRASVDAEPEPLDRLRAFTIRLHEWCDPNATALERGAQQQRAIGDFAMYLGPQYADRIHAAVAPITRLLRDLISAGNESGVICAADPARAAAQMQQFVCNSWFGRFVANPIDRPTAEETWDFCLRALGG